MGRIVWALVCSLRTVIVWAVGERSRTLYNRAVFETLIVRGGCIAEPRYAAPFRLVLGVDEFEQGSLERQRLIPRLGSAARRRLRSVGGATYAAATSNDAATGSATSAREATPVVTSAPLTRKPSRHA